MEISIKGIAVPETREAFVMIDKPLVENIRQRNYFHIDTNEWRSLYLVSQTYVIQNEEPMNRDFYNHVLRINRYHDRANVELGNIFRLELSNYLNNFAIEQINNTLYGCTGYFSLRIPVEMGRRAALEDDHFEEYQLREQFLRIAQ